MRPTNSKVDLFRFVYTAYVMWAQPLTADGVCVLVLMWSVTSGVLGIDHFSLDGYMQVIIVHSHTFKIFDHTFVV
jgi:hypothetical protein